MPLDTTALPLVAYAVGFQTLVYVLLPGRIRTRWAPLVTGLVGAALVILAGIWFGFDTIGLGIPDGGTVAAWGVGTILVMSMVAMVMLSHPQLRGQLADPRMAAMTRREAASQILIRIPIMTALIEEAVFRGVLHTALIALYPAPIALWAGAALFGMWHVGPGFEQAKATARRTRASVGHVLLTVVVTTLVGAGLVWLRMETGSIWAPLAVHAGLNMTMAVFARTAASKFRPTYWRLQTTFSISSPRSGATLGEVAQRAGGGTADAQLGAPLPAFGGTPPNAHFVRWGEKDQIKY